MNDLSCGDSRSYHGTASGYELGSSHAGVRREGCVCKPHLAPEGFVP